MGRINLNEMVVLPKILYILWHAKIYLPLRIFKFLEAILNTFVWGNSYHKLSWNTLKNPTHLGGTALLDFIFYYLSAQLSHFFHLDKGDRDWYLALVCSPFSQVITHRLFISYLDIYETLQPLGVGRVCYTTTVRFGGWHGNRLALHPCMLTRPCGTTPASLNYCLYPIANCGYLKVLYIFLMFIVGVV